MPGDGFKFKVNEEQRQQRKFLTLTPFLMLLHGAGLYNLHIMITEISACALCLINDERACNIL